MKHPLYNVLCRELRRMTSRRLYFGVCLVLPLFCLFFMATILGSGQTENIPIGIVDQDNTTTSRQIVRNISAVPTFKVTRHFTDETAARQAVQRKEIYGYLSIPTGFTQRATTGMNATLSYYYHYALLSVGSELMAAFETALAPVALSPIAMEAVSLGVSQEQITTFLLPVQSSMHPLYNPDLDYSIYLSQPFFYVLFQILILLITVYIIGSELKFHTAQEWLTTARENILTAVVGKLLPYTFIFSVIGILANYILYGVLHIPFHGSLLMMNLMTILFIIATQTLAVFIFSIFPRIAYIISIVSMVGSLGATLSGVTFPVTSMYPPVHAASYLFPVRHFTEIAQSMLYFDSGFGYYWQSAAILWLFPLVALLILPRLKHWILKDKEELSICENETPLPRVHNTPHYSIATVIFREWRSISTNAAILLVLMGGIFAYGLLYNLMYAPNLVRKTPVAIVDNSHSALSREYIRTHYGEAAAEHAVVFEDEGFSGGNLNRPDFKKMMTAAKDRKFKAIVVYRLDRISRNISDFSSLIEELARLDISLVSIKEQFDTSTPMGRAMMYIASVFSQLERETIAERIRDNMHELAKTGRWLGGTTPTGYASEAVKSITIDG